MNLKENIDLLQHVVDNGGAFCIHYGITFTTIRDARKHDLAEHYDYALMQCNGDKKLLKEWVNLP